MTTRDPGSSTDWAPVPGIDRDEVLARQQRARELAEAGGYDALLVISRSFYDRPGDVAYLTNHFPPFPTTVFSDHNRGMGHAIFLLPIQGESVLLTDPRGYRVDLVPVADVRRVADLGAAAIALLRERGLERGRIGLVGADIFPAAFDRAFAAALPGLRLEPDRDIIAGMRRIKSPAEQALLRRAARCADAGLRAAVEALGGGEVTEREVCAAGIAAAMRAGADFVRYLRVHSGPWSAAGSRWPQAMDRRIEPGDVIEFDIVGAYQGYQFDVNRVTALGRLDAERERLLDTAAEAVDGAVAACVAGARVADIVARAREVIGRSPFAEHMGAMMGHGIGLETVELPYLQATGGELLEPGMVLCVEPGIFVPGWAGAAIEQEVIIQAEGPAEVITPTPTLLW